MYSYNKLKMLFILRPLFFNVHCLSYKPVLNESSEDNTNGYFINYSLTSSFGSKCASINFDFGLNCDYLYSVSNLQINFSSELKEISCESVSGTQINSENSFTGSDCGCEGMVFFPSSVGYSIFLNIPRSTFFNYTSCNVQLIGRYWTVDNKLEFGKWSDKGSFNCVGVQLKPQDDRGVFVIRDT